ncbi:MAG: histidine kinase [Cyclobacteriaceae bacterium]
MFNIRYRYLYIFLLGTYSYLNIVFTESERLFGYAIAPFFFYAVILLITLIVWEGNRLVSSIAFKLKVPFAVHPLIIFFLMSLVMVSVVAITTTSLLSLYYSHHLYNFLTLKLSLGFAFRINLFLHCVNAIYFFVNQYNDARFEAETLKKQTAEARFQALKNQINPHFLFNSFNVLSSLVYKDVDASSKFINQLSNVYRYLLFNQQNKVVQLFEEMKFIESYMYLLKIRFQDNLRFTIDIPEALNTTYIAPSTLQLLIENAIKHNVVSKNNPLHIKIASDSEHLIVQNTIQLKEVKEESSQLGLANIKSRYDYLGGKDALVIESNGEFKVKIPILHLDS